MNRDFFHRYETLGDRDTRTQYYLYLLSLFLLFLSIPLFLSFIYTAPQTSPSSTIFCFSNHVLPPHLLPLSLHPVAPTTTPNHYTTDVTWFLQVFVHMLLLPILTWTNLNMCVCLICSIITILTFHILINSIVKDGNERLWQNGCVCVCVFCVYT